MKMYRDQLALVEKTLLPLLHAMPASLYDFAPVTGVRTFGEQARHLATLLFLTSAIILGECSPYAPGDNDNGPANIATKDQVLAYLAEALAYARKAMDSLTEANHLEVIATYFGPMPKAEVAAGIIYHSYNHYGQLVVYARINGVAPAQSL
jgi:uncharacterized damage-inducible protein DinB